MLSLLHKLWTPKYLWTQPQAWIGIPTRQLVRGSRLGDEFGAHGYDLLYHLTNNRIAVLFDGKPVPEMLHP